jgi:hypothetical protein
MVESDVNEADDRGYLGEFGVVIVPPGDSEDRWFVGLTRWDEGSERYVAESDGPLLDNPEEAMKEAQKVLDWLAAVPEESDVARLWREMQQRVGAETVLEREWPPSRGPWGDWNPR